MKKWVFYHNYADNMQIVITPIIIIIIMIIIYYEFPPVKPNIQRNTGYFLMKNNHLNYKSC